MGMTMTTLTLQVSNPCVLDELKQMLSRIAGVKIVDSVDAEDETAYISSSSAMLDLLRKGDQETEEGKGTPMKVEDLWN